MGTTFLTASRDGVECGANLSATKNAGDTVANLASQSEHSDVLSLILEEEFNNMSLFENFNAASFGLRLSLPKL